MALTTATLSALATELGTLITHISLHSADPGATGANEHSTGGYARQAVTWGVSNGVLSLTGAENFTGPASGVVTHVGLWSALTVGTFRGGYAITGDQAFNLAGEYTVDTGVITGSSS